MPLDDTNLVWKAAAALWTALGRAGEPRDAVVTIDKTIPMEAGLGGGSADAAAALLALARLWGGAPITLLREVGSGIGADVPFFLSGGTALGLGRGEEIYPLVDLPPHWVVIVRPPFGVSTGEAYALVRRGPDGRAEGNARAPDPAGAVADARGADDQRPRAAGGPPSSGDHRRSRPRCGSRGRRRRRCRAAARPFSACSAAAPPAARCVRPLLEGGARALLTRTLTRAEYERRARPVAKRP